MRFTKITQLSKGWSSYIWLVKDANGGEFVLKEVREKSPRKDLANREGKMLLLANSAGVGPKVKEVNYKQNYVVMEYVKGPKLLDFVFSEEFAGEVTREQLLEFLKELYRQLIAIDSVHLSHNQLQVGKNVLVKKIGGTNTPKYWGITEEQEKLIGENPPEEAKNKKLLKKNAEAKYVPVIIDFEKASIKPNGTKNIGQIESFLFYNPHGGVAQRIREKLNAKL